jgi:hypothetical protein
MTTLKEEYEIWNKKTMTTLKEEYDIWNKKTQPKDAPQVQTTETRRAFYAGSFFLFNLIQNISTRHSEDEASELLEKIDKEITDFFDAVKNGKA